MKEKIEKCISRALTVVTVLCVTLCLVVCSKVILNKDLSVLGFRLFHVVTGSMEPTIRTGSLVLVHETPWGKLKERDIITFTSRDAYLNGAANTHRIMRFTQDEEGRVCLVTRGDANNTEDDTRVYPEDILGKVVYYSNMNEFSTFLNFVKSLPGFLTVIVLPLMLVGLGILKSFRKELAAVREAGEAQAAAAEPAPDPVLTALAEAGVEKPSEELLRAIAEKLAEQKQEAEKEAE